MEPQSFSNVIELSAPNAQVAESLATTLLELVGCHGNGEREEPRWPICAPVLEAALSPEVPATSPSPSTTS